MNPTQAPNTLNGIDVAALSGVVDAIGQDPALAKVSFEVETTWQGQTRSESRVSKCSLGGEVLDRTHTIRSDEPLELLGSNVAPNPQELILAALNSCTMVGYVAGASVHGIELESVKIITAGSLDLQGFLGLDETMIPGFDGLTYTVQNKSDGTPDQFEAEGGRPRPPPFRVPAPARIETRSS